MTNRADIRGMTFGRLTVLDDAPSAAKYPKVKCSCSCGVIKEVGKYNLTGGKTLSCGCLHKERASLTSRKIIEGVKSTDHPLYSTWTGILTRCRNPNRDHAGYYLGRGIKVCKRWENSFMSFVYDMGAKPSPSHSIDRIDNDGDYTPENCRWATMKEQCKNRRVPTYVK